MIPSILIEADVRRLALELGYVAMTGDEPGFE